MHALRLSVVVACAATALVVAGTAPAWVPRTWTSKDLYVSPRGSDSNTGRSALNPLRTIQAALDLVQPGGTVHLAAGTYRETPHTVRDGTAVAPITIRGGESGLNESTRGKTVVTGQGRIFNIDNSHYRLQGFTVDGEPGLAGTTFPTSLSEARAFKDGIQSSVVDSKLVYVGSGDSVRGVNDVVVRDMLLRRAGGECVRIRNDADNITVTASLILWCGLYGTGDDSTSYRYHNGEGVYIGTSPKSTGQPLAGNDTTGHVLVSGNQIRTYGSECVDVKERSHDNTITQNTCADDDEPASFYGSLLELRGPNNTVDHNTISDSRGAGVKLSSDDQSVYPLTGNAVRSNSFARIASAPVQTSISLAPSALCGNSYDGVVNSSLLAELVAPC
jgi:hypothetical protein